MSNRDEALLLGKELEWICIPVYLHQGAWMPPYKYLHLAEELFDVALWERLWDGHDSAPGIAAVWPKDIVVAEADSEDGAEWLRLKKFTRTPTFNSRRGPHYLFRGSGEGLNPAPAPGVEVLSYAGSKRLMILPPTGGKAWLPSLGPFEVKFVPVPSSLKGAKSNGHKRERVKITGEPLPDGDRNKALASIVGKFVSSLTPAEALAASLAYDAQHCKPPLGEKRITRMVEDFVTKDAPVSSPLPPVSEGESRTIDELLGAVESFLRRFVVLSDAQAAAVVLWVAHTYAIDAAPVAVYLHVHSAEKRSGKTTLLEGFSFLVRDPITAANMSPAVLFRVLDGRSAPVLLDEVDTIFTARTEREELRGLLNAGYRRGTGAWRIETTGKKHEPTQFDVFGPKVLAGLGRLPDTTADRSIPIELTRKARTQRVERWRIRGKNDETAPLRASLVRWAEEAVPELQDAWPDLPEELDDRAQDVWEGLLAIADVAGGDWPTRARAAAVELHAGREEASVGSLLLAHIARAFEEKQTDRLTSEELVRALVENEEGPWPRWWSVDSEGGTRSAKSKLAKLLRPFGVIPQRIRIGASTPRGYLRSDLVEVWEKYSEGPSPQGATGATDATSQVGPTSSVSGVAGVASIWGVSEGGDDSG